MLKNVKNFSFGKSKNASENSPVLETLTSKSQLVILVDREFITLVDVQTSSKDQLLLGKPLKIPWTKESLSELQDVELITDDIETFVILGQDLAKVETIEVDLSKGEALDAAKSLTQEKFASTYNNLGIDYSILSSSDESAYVQLFITKKSLLALLGSVFEELHLDVRSVLPLASALTAQVEVSDKPQVLLWGEEYLVFCLIQEGQVIHAELVNGDNIYKQIEALLSWCKENYSLEITETIMASKKLNKQKIKGKVKTEELNPFVGAISQNDEFSVDPVIAEEIEEDLLPESEVEDETIEKSSIIDSTEVVAPKPPLKLVDASQEKQMDSVTPPNNKPNTKLIAIIVTVIVVLIGMVVGGLFVYQNAMKEANEAPVVVTDTPNQPTEYSEPESATDSAVPQDTEEEIDFASIKAEVLNGSGTPGAAGTMADLIEGIDITDIDTGNADSYDYEETVLQVKAGQDKLYEEVLSQIQDDYTVIQGEDLPESSEYDVVITVGTK